MFCPECGTPILSSAVEGGPPHYVRIATARQRRVSLLALPCPSPIVIMVDDWPANHGRSLSAALYDIETALPHN
jgi:hypothetical protein